MYTISCISVKQNINNQWQRTRGPDGLNYNCRPARLQTPAGIKYN